MVVFSVKNVGKSYKKTVALRDVNLELHQGEILALLGANGSGKTTFVKILATLLSKDAGKVEIMGYDLDTQEEKIRPVIGYVGQDTERSAYARLTVRENLEFFASLRGLKRDEANSRIKKLSEYFEFEESMQKEFMHLSGGQKQMVVIMRSLLHDPPIIYLDEPTKGLDPFASKRIRTFLKEYTEKEGKSLLLTSHILSEVDELVSRVSLISEGTNPITGTLGELKMAVGAKDFIEIRKDAMPQSTIEKILKLKTVIKKLEREADWLSFGISNFFDGTEDIIRVLREDGIEAGFRYHSVTLEDAFVHHLGVLNEKFDA